jgi:hypothetical protein
VDSSAQLWAIVLKEGEKYDKALAESWKGDMDGILFFVRGSLPFDPCPPIHNLYRQAYSLPPSQHL